MCWKSSSLQHVSSSLLGQSAFAELLVNQALLLNTQATFVSKYISTLYLVYRRTPMIEVIVRVYAVNNLCP